MKLTGSGSTLSQKSQREILELLDCLSGGWNNRDNHQGIFPHFVESNWWNVTQLPSLDLQIFERTPKCDWVSGQFSTMRSFFMVTEAARSIAAAVLPNFHLHTREHLSFWPRVQYGSHCCIFSALHSFTTSSCPLFLSYLMLVLFNPIQWRG